MTLWGLLMFFTVALLLFSFPLLLMTMMQRDHMIISIVSSAKRIHTHSHVHSLRNRAKWIYGRWQTDTLYSVCVCVRVKYSHFVPFAAHLNMCSISYENGNKMLWMHLYIHYPLCYSYACMYVGADVSQTYVWNYIRMVMYMQTRPTPSNNKHKSHTCIWFHSPPCTFGVTLFCPVFAEMKCNKKPTRI